jgi:hypothetical protein
MSWQKSPDPHSDRRRMSSYTTGALFRNEKTSICRLKITISEQAMHGSTKSGMSQDDRTKSYRRSQIP